MFEHEGRGGGAERDLRAAAETLADLDWAALDDDESLGLAATLARASRVVDAALAAGLAAIDRSGAAHRASGLRAAGWLAHLSRTCGGSTTWRLQTGLLMERFPVLGAAARSGDVGPEHLRVLGEVRGQPVLEELARQDAELCEAARRLDLVTWRREVRTRVADIRDDLQRRRAEAEAVADPTDAGRTDPGGGPADPEPADPDPADAAGRGEAEALFDHVDPAAPAAPETPAPLQDGWLSLRPTAAGGLLLRGELFGAPAEVVRQIVEATTSRQRRAAWAEHDRTGVPVPPAGTLRAQALIELVTRGRDAHPGVGGGSRAEAVVVMAADDDLAARVRALDGEPLPPEVAAALTCDAHLQALVTDRAGHPLWLGRGSRLASAAQRRVLAIRDGGCVFPGCDMPADWCDAHHQPGWEQGGHTDVDEMVLLCRRHHGAAHSTRWMLRPGPGTAPTSRTRGSPRAGPADPDRAARRFEWLDHATGRTLPARQRGLV